MESMEWFTFRAACDGTLWTVFLADKISRRGTGCRRGETLHGVTDFERRAIFIRAASDEHTQNETMFHEMMHVAYGPARVGRDNKEHERQVGLMSPGLYAMAKQRGMRWPRRPNGWRTLITEE